MIARMAKHNGVQGAHEHDNEQEEDMEPAVLGRRQKDPVDAQEQGRGVAPEDQQGEQDKDRLGNLPKEPPGSPGHQFAFQSPEVKELDKRPLQRQTRVRQYKLDTLAKGEL